MSSRPQKAAENPKDEHENEKYATKPRRLELANERIRELMGHALEDPITRRTASRETFSSPQDVMRIVRDGAAILGAEALLKRIVNANAVGDLIDCVTEMRYALVFHDIRFRVEFVKQSREPSLDILVARDETNALIEVTRIRPPHVNKPPVARRTRVSSAADDLITDLLDLEADGTKAIEDQLREKFRQVRAAQGTGSIIACWSDRDFVEEIDFEQAVRNIRRSGTDPADGRGIPENLKFCIFGRFWQRADSGQYLYPEAPHALDEPYTTWMRELRLERLWR